MRPYLPAFVAAVFAYGCTGRVAHPSADIRNVLWHAVEIGGQPALFIPRPATLLLAAEGRASGSGSCNQWFAEYRLKRNSIMWGQIGSTRIGCGVAAGEQEKAYLEILQAVDRYSLGTDGTLTLATPQGKSINFRR